MKKHGLQIVVALTLWGILLYIVLGVDPELIADVVIEGAYLPLFVALAMAVWYTGALILASWWRATLVTVMMVLLLVLQLWRVLTFWTLLASMVLLIFTLWQSYRVNDKVKSNITSISKSEGNS